jgi:catechol 2,3-dioxygenase-like lactoylglutathione lyase family enzyme
MLGDKDVAATLAVKDLGAAREFYEGTLGLALVADLDGGVLYRSGNSMVLVYESEFAGTNQATAASWSVDDVEEVMQALRDKGVTFEQYDLPGVTREGDLHIMGDLKGAWFKDPDGNILSIGNPPT